MSRHIRAPFAPHNRAMKEVPRDEWPTSEPESVEGVWSSRDYLAMLYSDPNGHRRLSINSTTIDRQRGRWRDGLTWDELMLVKEQCGFGDTWAVEVYPPAAERVDVANIRHLWLLDGQPDYAWAGDAA